MGYHLTTSPDQPATRSHASPKTHTPLPRLQERGHRYYSPDIGRWVSRDPFEEVGGINLNVIAGNDVVNRMDYLGLTWWLPDPDTVGMAIARWLNEHGWLDHVPDWRTEDNDFPVCPPGTIMHIVLEIRRVKYDDVHLWALIESWQYKFYRERLKIIKRGCCCGGTASAVITSSTSRGSRSWGVEWFGIWQSVLVTETTVIETPCRMRLLE